MKTGKTMSKNMKKAEGFLAKLLAKQDMTSMTKTRNRMLIAAKIDMALRQKGMSQKQFSVMMHKSESEVSEWLSGDRNFTIDTLTEISEALSVDLLNTSLVNMYYIPDNNLREKMRHKSVVFKNKRVPHVTYSTNVIYNTKEKQLIDVC